MTNIVQRKLLIEHAEYLISKAPQIGYEEIRPMKSNHFKNWHMIESYLAGGGELSMDCSESVTSLFRWTGLHDPNGLNYNGTGYTGTLYDHLPHYYKVEDAHPGALLIFGRDPTVHVCMLMERDGDNPWLFSHGSANGPYHIRLSDERGAHVGQAETWLNVGGL